MKKFDIVDIVLGFFIILGVIMTAFNFFANRGPSSEIVDSSVTEITPSQPPQRHFGQPITDDRPIIKLSEARPIVRRYVEDINDSAKAHGLGGLNEKQKSEMVESIIDGMKARGTYEFVDQ